MASPKSSVVNCPLETEHIMVLDKDDDACVYATDETLPTPELPATVAPELATIQNLLATPNQESVASLEPEQVEIAKSGAIITTLEQIDRPPNGRHASTASMVAQPISIFWRTPMAMVSTLAIGIGCFVALHCYYSSLNHRLVGNANDQQRSLQIGTAGHLLRRLILCTRYGQRMFSGSGEN